MPSSSHSNSCTSDQEASNNPPKHRRPSVEFKTRPFLCKTMYHHYNKNYADGSREPVKTNQKHTTGVSLTPNVKKTIGFSEQAHKSTPTGNFNPTPLAGGIDNSAELDERREEKDFEKGNKPKDRETEAKEERRKGESGDHRVRKWSTTSSDSSTTRCSLASYSDKQIATDTDPIDDKKNDEDRKQTIGPDSKKASRKKVKTNQNTSLKRVQKEVHKNTSELFKTVHSEINRMVQEGKRTFCDLMTANLERFETNLNNLVNKKLTRVRQTGTSVGKDEDEHKCIIITPKAQDGSFHLATALDRDEAIKKTNRGKNVPKLLVELDKRTSFNVNNLRTLLKEEKMMAKAKNDFLYNGGDLKSLQRHLVGIMNRSCGEPDYRISYISEDPRKDSSKKSKKGNTSKRESIVRSQNEECTDESDQEIGVLNPENCEEDVYMEYSDDGRQVSGDTRQSRSSYKTERKLKHPRDDRDDEEAGRGGCSRQVSRRTKCLSFVALVQHKLTRCQWSETEMVFENAFDHIIAPVDGYHLCALRNAAICGVLAFAFLIVGVKQLVTLVVYMFAIAAICVSAWLYSLPNELSCQVMSRIRDVVVAFWRKCVDESFGDIVSKGSTCKNKYRGPVESSSKTMNSKGQPVVGPTGEERLENIDALSKEFTSLFQLN
ncbi:hypothetical protein J6590_104047 [Homalodisca vitripennis]|nr:hypothetical protein J6590_104047 [Homalodisca vitripennis]